MEDGLYVAMSDHVLGIFCVLLPGRINDFCVHTADKKEALGD